MANGKSEDMARLIVAQKKSDGNYRYRQKMVPVERVDEEIEAIKAAEREEN